MAIEVVNKQRLVRIDARGLERLADAALSSVGRANRHITVVFVRDRAIRSLNRKYRFVDHPTDVLSFPTGESTGTDAHGYLGDIAISVDTALRQAQAAGHSLQRELDELLIHGVLHLCGYDHATDRGQMNRMELRLRRTLLDK